MQKVVEVLKEEFGTKVIVKENTVKTTVQSINGNQIWGLKDIYEYVKVKDITLKRSGTGITIIVEFND